MGSNPVLSFAFWMAQVLPTPLRRSFYHMGPITGWLRRTLNNAAPTGRSLTKIAAGDLAGASMLLDLQSEKDYWLGTYEPELQAAVHHFLHPGMVIYDVGANIGYISLLLARHTGPDGQVFAFEALPANVERLKENLSLNPFAGRVQVVESAVVDKSGELPFLVHSSTSMGKAVGSAGRTDESYPNEIIVNGLCLDDFALQQNHPLPNAVKMDIEGGEVLALQGMQRLLREVQPILFLELHGQQAVQTAWSILSGAGYVLKRMEAGYPRIYAEDEMDWKAYVVAVV